MFRVELLLRESMRDRIVHRLPVVSRAQTQWIVSWNHLDVVLVIIRNGVNDSQVILIHTILDPHPLTFHWQIKLCLIVEDFRHLLKRKLIDLVIAEVEALDCFTDTLKFVGLHEDAVLDIRDVDRRKDRERLAISRVVNLLVHKSHRRHSLLTFFDVYLPQLWVVDGWQDALVLVHLSLVVHLEFVLVFGLG